MEHIDKDRKLNKIKELLKSDDFDLISKGLKLARSLQEKYPDADLYKELLVGCFVDEKGKLINEKKDFNNYVLYCLLVDSAELISEESSSYLKKLTSLDFSNCKFLKNVDSISKLTNLKDLNLNYCTNLENLDGLAKLNKLETLHIYCDFVSNVDFLKNLTELKMLSFHGGKNLVNMDGVANLMKLEYLDLYETPSNLIWLDADETGDLDDAEFEDWPLTEDRLAVWFLYMFGSKHKRSYKGGYNFDAIKKDLDVQGFRHELY